MVEHTLRFLEKMKNNCVFAGTFDPITIGHTQLINKCIENYDKVFVVVGENPNKTPLLPISVRLDAVKQTFNDKVIVVNYQDYKENYRKFLLDNDIKFYVRGIRNDIDLEYEKEYAQKNAKLYPEITTVFIKADEELKDVSSSVIRELIQNKKDYLSFIPQGASQVIVEYLNSKR